MKDPMEKGKEIINNLELPSEVILDVPKVTILGYEEITIENHKGIIEFDTSLVRINTKLGPIKIEGRGLEIEYIGAHTLVISGRCNGAIYEKGVQLDGKSK